MISTGGFGSAGLEADSETGFAATGSETGFASTGLETGFAAAGSETGFVSTGLETGFAAAGSETGFAAALAFFFFFADPAFGADAPFVSGTVTVAFGASL